MHQTKYPIIVSEIFLSFRSRTIRFKSISTEHRVDVTNDIVILPCTKVIASWENEPG